MTHRACALLSSDGGWPVVSAEFLRSMPGGDGNRDTVRLRVPSHGLVEAERQTVQVRSSPHVDNQRMQQLEQSLPGKHPQGSYEFPTNCRKWKCSVELTSSTVCSCCVCSSRVDKGQTSSVNRQSAVKPDEIESCFSDH